MADVRQLLPRSYNAFFGQFARLRSAQEQAIPPIVDGRNVLLISTTGSGKTEAAVAPLAEQSLEVIGETVCLYICPTRALVNDIERRIESPLGKIGLRVGVRHGDRKTLQGKLRPNILITTPESLDVMLSSARGEERERLRAVRAVIVDEAHQFYQTHRGYQLILLLERLKWLTKARLQRVLLSATVAQPAALARWFQGSDDPFDIVRIMGGRKIRVLLDHLTAADGPTFREGNAVVELLEPIVREQRKVLLFANSRNECDWLYWKVHDRLGVPTYLHYSTLDREFRETTERRFQQSGHALCIATSTLELGVDIGDIDAVVMYGAPASISSFIQRTGRGNRRENTCTVYGFCRAYNIDGSILGPEHDLVLFYALVASMLESELETRSDSHLFSVLVQQACSLANRYEAVVVEQLEKLVRAAEHVPVAGTTDLVHILDTLAAADFFRFDPQRQAYYPIEGWENLKRNLEIWGNIASTAHSTAVDKHKEVRLALVPHGKARPGEVFLIAGQPRMITDVSAGMVHTAPLAASDPKLISYQTMGASTPPTVVQKVRDLLQISPFPDLPVEADDALRTLMVEYRRRFRNLPLRDVIAFEQQEARYCYYTFGGTWANEILALVLKNQALHVRVDSWRIYSPKPILSFANVPTEEAALEKLVRSHLRMLVERMQLSCHFEHLPIDLQHREVCSLLDLRQLSEWFTVLSRKRIIPLP